MLNQASLDLIKRWEGCKLKAYKCSAGVWTVGYGLTTNAGFIEVGPDTTITQAEADWYLEKTIEKFLAEITPAITAPINENELGGIHLTGFQYWADCLSEIFSPAAFQLWQ